MITARNLITNAAVTAGIIGVSEDLNANEAVQALNELNNLIEGLSLESYYPNTNVSNEITIDSPLFTIGKKSLFTTGQTTQTFTSGSITGLSSDVTSTIDPSSVVFNNPIITDSEGIQYVCTGTLTLRNGTIAEAGGGDRTDANSVGVTFNGPSILAGTTLELTNASFTVNGTFYQSGDVFADRPNRVISVTQLTEGITRPLIFIPENDWDKSVKSNTSVTYPTYYTTRGTFPFMTIEVYPSVSSATFNIVSQIVSTQYGLNDEIELPTGYVPVLQFQLAVILAEDYGYAAKVQSLSSRANKALARVKKLNNQGALLSNSGSPGQRTGYDFNTDSWR